MDEFLESFDLDVGVSAEFGNVCMGHQPPVLAILDPLRSCRKREVIFAVEPTRTLGNSCVQSVH